MWSGNTLLDPISGEIVGAELERREQELFEADWADAKARLGRDPRPGELDRTPGQRRADALVEMARRSATAPAGGKAPKPLFQVLLGSDAFSHLLQLARGQVLPPTALLPWLSSADLERYLPDRPHPTLGRRRHHRPKQRPTRLRLPQPPPRTTTPTTTTEVSVTPAVAPPLRSCARRSTG